MPLPAENDAPSSAARPIIHTPFLTIASPSRPSCAPPRARGRPLCSHAAPKHTRAQTRPSACLHQINIHINRQAPH